jgi:hypothetical protein
MRKKTDLNLNVLILHYIAKILNRKGGQLRVYHILAPKLSQPSTFFGKDSKIFQFYRGQPLYNI